MTATNDSNVKPEPAKAEVQSRGDAGARIAAELREEILQGKLAPGDRIRQHDVAERFGASRVPVREALSILVHDGLLSTVSNSGTWVASLTLDECIEVYEMRERLEPLLLARSAPMLTQDDFAHLRDLCQRIDEATQSGDLDTFMRLDREFHLATYAHANTLQLDEVITKLWNSTGPYRRAYVSRWSDEQRRIANDEHNMMIATLEEGDFDEGERVLAGHIRRTRRQLAHHPEIFDSPSQRKTQQN